MFISAPEKQQFQLNYFIAWVKFNIVLSKLIQGIHGKANIRLLVKVKKQTKKKTANSHIRNLNKT